MSIKLNRKGAGLAGEDRVKENQNLEMIEQEFNSLDAVKEDSAAARLSALEAMAKADAADSLSKNVQTQLNTIVVSGDSSPQATQASVGARGEDYGGNLKARLDAEFNETAAQLAEKAEKEEVRLRSVLISQTDVTDEFRQQMVGTTPINAVPAKGSLETVRVKPKGINENGVSFIEPSKNLFNGASAVSGYQVDTSTGELAAWSGRSTSNFIHIKIIDYVYNFNMRAYAFYDQNYTFISGGLTNFTNKTFIPPANAVFIRFSMDDAWVVNAQFETGTVATAKEEYKLKLRNSNYESEINLAKQSVDSLVVGLGEPLEVGSLSKNLGEFTSHRSANNTFNGWAYPFEKSMFSKNITRIEGFFNIGANENKEITLIILNELRTIELFSVKTTFSREGKIVFNVNIPLSILPNNFYIGFKTDGTHGIMPANATPLQGYTSTGTYYFSTEWALGTATYNITDMKVYTGFETALKPHTHNASEIIGLSTGENKVKLSLPDKYELVVGDMFELFFKGIVYASDPYSYNIKVGSPKGKAYRRKYEYRPVSGDIGTHALTISIFDDNDIELDSKTLNLIVKAKASNPSTSKNILTIGDSLTANGEWVTELHKRLVIQDGLTNLNFIGTRGDTVKYEGYGGWTVDRYLSNENNGSVVWIIGTHDKDATDQHSIYQDSNGTQWKLETIESGRIKVIRHSGTTTMPPSGSLTLVSGGTHGSNIVYTSTLAESNNPFWNSATNTVDFAKYATDRGVSSIDYINILLGWNNTGSTESAYKASMRTLINRIRSAFPANKITLVGLQVADIDGLGANYGASWNFKETLSFVFKMNQWLTDIAGEFSDVVFVNLAGQFDSEYNMPRSERDVNVRNSTHKEWRGFNAVHPALEGYLQIADAVYRNLQHKI